MGDKVHKSLRIDVDLAERVSALRADGETETATYLRAIEEGVTALEGGIESGNDQEAEGDRKGPQSASQQAIDALTRTIDLLAEQLEAKDEQIRTLSALTNQAQQLHAMGDHKALEDRRAGFFSRLFG